MVKETTYYVRSSVLGGQVISETTASGGKKKTNVYAAGSKLAVQSEYTYNSTTTESVTFEHFDASGMSFRSSLSNGGAIVDAGDYESAPGEFDPLGGNAGIETPYVEDPPPDPEPGPLNPNYPIFDDAPMIVNGQQVSCTLDGLSAPCSLGLGGLGNATDIDWSTTDAFTVRALGIFAYWEPSNGSEPTPRDPNPEPDVYNVDTNNRGGNWVYFYANVSWQLQDYRLTPVEIRTLRRTVEWYMSDRKCAHFVEDVLNTAKAMFRNSEPMWSDYLMGMFDAVEVQGGFRYGNSIVNSSLKFEGSTFFGLLRTENAGIEFAIAYSRRWQAGGSTSQATADQMNSQQRYSMGITTIHELMHHAGFTDQQLAEAAATVLGPEQELALERGMRGRNTVEDKIMGWSSYFTNRLAQECDSTGNRRARPR